MTLSRHDDSKIKSILSGHAESKKMKTLEPKKDNDVDDYKQLYKDSVDILGVSLDELEEFMNPDKLTKNEQNSVEKILEKFRNLNDFDDISHEVTKKNEMQKLQMSEDIDAVQDYCLKLIDGIGNLK